MIGVPDEVTGQAIVAFVIPRGRRRRGLTDELRDYVAEKIGKLARPKRIVVCDDLPKTRSGKIMRRILRDIATGEDDLGDVTTLRDPDVVEDVQKQFAAERPERATQRRRLRFLRRWPCVSPSAGASAPRQLAGVDRSSAGSTSGRCPRPRRASAAAPACPPKRPEPRSGDRPGHRLAGGPGRAGGRSAAGRRSAGRRRGAR